MNRAQRDGTRDPCSSQSTLQYWFYFLTSSSTQHSTTTQGSGPEPWQVDMASEFSSCSLLILSVPWGSLFHEPSKSIKMSHSSSSFLDSPWIPLYLQITNSNDFLHLKQISMMKLLTGHRQQQTTPVTELSWKLVERWKRHRELAGCLTATLRE